MTDPLSSILRLRRLRAAAEAGQPLPPEVAAWLARAIADYERSAADGARLDVHLGLVPPAGGKAWWTREATARRDAEIRAIAAEQFSTLNRRRQAEEIRRILRRRGQSLTVRRIEQILSTE
jgi:hypothetical protein